MPTNAGDLEPMPSFEDELTGLYNRRYLYTYLETRVPWPALRSLPNGTTPASDGEGGEKPAGPVSVLLLDFDHFRSVNEDLSERVGDIVLNQFGGLLREVLRADDLAGRHGGDSFMLVLPGLGKDDAIALGDRIRARLDKEPLGPRDQPAVGLVASGGVATFPEDASDPGALVEAVDRALYVAKRVGGNRISASGRLDADLAAERALFDTLPCRTFVDREHEMASAIGLFDQLCARKPVLAFVQGEAGAGKSRFLREYAARARTAGLLHLYVSCDESKKFVPGHALLQFVDRYYEKRADDGRVLRGRLNQLQRAAIRDFVPAFATWPPEANQPAARDRRHFMQQAIEAAIAAMSEATPLLFILDNVGFCDRGTLEILRTLIRDRKLPIGLAFALKGDLTQLDMKKDAALFDLVAEIEKRGLKEFALPPLPHEDLVRLVRAILPGAELPEAYAELIAEAAHGSPLYVEQTLRLLMMTGKIRRTGAGWHVVPVEYDELPESLDEAVQAVIDHLPQEASEILTNAAVLGATFDFRTLQAISGRREAEMFDIVDRIEDLGLLQAPVGGRATELEFTSGHVREVRYTTIPENARKRLHARASTALQEQGGLAAVEAHFHNELSKNDVRPPTARMIAVSEEPLRRARIPEAKTPLTPEATEIALEFLNALTGLLRIGRLYPEDSRTRDDFRDRLRRFAQRLLAAAPAVTFSMDARGPKLNAQPLPFRRDAILEDTANLLAEKLISSLTLQAGVTDVELDDLVAGLAAPLERETAPPDHWDRFLDRQRVKNIDILQQRYVSHDTKTHRRPTAPAEARPKLEVPKERPLVPGELDVFWTAMRHLKGTADALRLYPTGHPLVEDAAALGARAFDRLLPDARIITLSIADQDLVCNGAPADAKAHRSIATWLTTEFRRKDIRSLSLKEGLSLDEIRALARVLIATDPNAASDAIARSGLEHVVFDVRTYQRVTPETMKPSAAPRETKRVVRGDTGRTKRRVKPPSTPTTQIEERARALLAAPVSDFVSEAVERELPTLIAALAGGAAQALAEDLAGRVAGCMREDEAAIRRRAVSMATRALSETSTAAKEMVLARFQDQLQLSLAAEREAGVVRLLGDAARAWMSAALVTNQIPALMQFLSGGLKLRYESGDAPVTLRTSVSATLKLLAERSPHPVIEAVMSGNPRARQAAVKVAGLMGASLTPTLVTLVSTHADAQVRRTAAAALKEIGGTAGTALADVVKPQSDANTITRVLEVFELASPANLSTVVLSAIRHPDAAVRQSAFRLLRRGERHAAVDTLRTLLAMEDAEIRSEALALARDRKLADLVPDVVRLCERLEDDNLLRQACYYFRECPSRSALPVLQRLFEKRTRIFGLVKGATSRTRAAAVEAMARINDPVVKQLMELAQEDRSQTVRRAAKPP